MATVSPVTLSTRHRLAAFVAAACSIALVLAGIVFVQSAHAASSLTKIFNAKTTGAISITGNALSGCQTSISTCVQAQNLQGSQAANNYFSAVPIDKDSDPSTQNSSSATVTVPQGGKVLAAYLFWSATQASTSSPKTIKFKAPGGSYQTLSPDSKSTALVGGSFNAFTAYADVTNIVASAGAGEYWGADVTTRYAATDQYAGWALVVVVEDPSMPMRDLSVFEGAVKVGSNSKVDTSVDGFMTPKSGPVQAKVGTVVWEGDKAYSGDWMEFDGKRLADPLSASNNFFTGVVSRDGENLTDRNPNTLSSMAVDAKVVDATGILANSQTSAKVSLGSNGDVYYLSALTTQIDLYVPDITPAKSVVNVSAGERGDDPGAPARVGDILEYTVAMLNKGQDTAVDTVFSDPIPDHTEYVPGSIRLNVGDSSTSLSDSAGDDAGEFAKNSVVVRLGEGASSTQGGRMPFKDAATVKFRVKLTGDSAGKTVTNQANVTYNGETDGGSTSRGSNALATPVAEAADLAVTKTGPQRANTGEAVEWTVTVRNNGPSAAKDSRLVDTVPAEVTNPRIVSPKQGCSLSGRTITCDFGTLESGDSRVVKIAGDLASDLDPAVSSVVNEAKVSSSTSDPDTTNNRASAVTSLGRSADVSVKKVVTDNPSPRPGETVTFTLTVANAGPSVAKAVSVTDALPDGLVAQGTPTTTAGTCSAAPENISCSLGDLAVGARETITVTARVPSTWTGTGPVANTAHAQSDITPDPDTSNNTSTASITVEDPQADLAVTKTLDSTEAVPGKDVTYNIHLTNKGPSQASDVTLTDKLPAGLTLVSVSSATEGCTGKDNVITCTYDRLAVGSKKSVTIVATIDPEATGTITNTASVSSPTKDPVPDNNSSTVTTPLTPKADLKLEKTTPPRIVAAGETVDFELTVTNNGPSRATDVRIADTLPAPLEYVSASGVGFTCTNSGAKVECVNPKLDPNAQGRVVIKARIPASANVTEQTEIVNTASVTSPTPDPNTGNNTAMVKVPTGTAADLEITKSGPAKAVAGEKVEWTLEVVNNGPSDASQVVVSDALPAQIVASSASVSTGSGPLTCAIEQGKVTCRGETLAAKASTTITVTGTISPTTDAAEMVNTATVSSKTPDPTTSNNSSSVTTQISKKADVSVTKSGPATAIVGENIVYTVTVTNNGPSAAADVVVTDGLPAGTTFVKASDPACSGVAGTESLTCSYVALAPGETRTIEITAHIVAGADIDKPLTNVVTVDSATPDPDPKNNRAEAKTTLEAKAKLVLSKTSEPDTFVAGTKAVYHLRVSNEGPSSAKNVVVSDTIPADLTPTSVQGPGTCAIEGQKVTCTIAMVAPTGDDPLDIHIDVDVAPGATGERTNAATVTTDTPLDPTSVTEAKVTNPLRASADVRIEKTSDTDVVYAGAGMSWNLTATNAGPSVARDVVITDTLPEHMELADVPDGCTYAKAERTLTCPVGDLAHGATKSIEVRVSVDPDYVGGGENATLTNHAEVTSSTPDPDPKNNKTDKSVEVKQKSKLGIQKTARTSSAVAGSEVEWVIVVRNEGPSTAHGVVVADTVAQALTVTSATFGESGTCAVSGRDVRCEIGDLPVGATTIILKTTIDKGFTGTTIPNTATVTSGSPSNATPPLSSTTEVGVSHAADLGIVKSAAALGADGKPIEGEPVAGDKVRFTFTVTNAGPSDSLGTAIDDVLPAGLSDVTFEPGDHGACSLDKAYDDPDKKPTSGKFTCTREGALAVGATWTITLTATLDADATGTITNTATVGGAWNDPDGSNNSSTVTVSPKGSADVSVVKTLSGTIVPGKRATWKLHVANQGPSVAHNVALVDTLPDGVSDVKVDSVSSADVTCSVTDRAVRCVANTLAPGSSVDVVVSGLVAADVTGPVVNVAQVTTTTPDPNEENNSSTVGGDPVPETSIHVVKTADPKTVFPGQKVTWTLTVSNDGPSTARDIAVTDPIDAQLEMGDIQAPEGTTCEVKDRTLQCHISTLAPGATTTISYDTRVASTAKPGTIANTVSVVTPNGGDGTPSTDESTTTVEVEPTPTPKPTPSETPSETPSGKPGQPGGDGGSSDPNTPGGSTTPPAGDRSPQGLAVTGAYGFTAAALAVALLGIGQGIRLGARRQVR